MKKILIAAVFILLFFFGLTFTKEVQAAAPSCLNFFGTIYKNNWSSGSITLSCARGRYPPPPAQPWCVGDRKVISYNGSDTYTLANCDCTVSNHVSLSTSLPAGCTATQEGNSGQNGNDIPNNVYVNCPAPTSTPTATPRPTNTPAPTMTPFPTSPQCGLCFGAQDCRARPGCGDSCNETTHTCYQSNATATPIPPANTGTPVPTGTPAPTVTPAQCIDGNICSGPEQCGGGLCVAGVCNCQGGGCVPGRACSAPRGVPIPTPDQHGDVCWSYRWGEVTAVCCREGRNWFVNRCLPLTTPAPTSTPAASPTPVQPTTEISTPPTPTVNPAVPTPTPARGQDPTARLSQRWVCLDSKPCSAGGCSGQGVVDHRAKISSKADVKPLTGTNTYVFECLRVPDPRRPAFTIQKCTTGNAPLDDSTIGRGNLIDLARNYGYRYNGIYKADGLTLANNPIPSSANNNGNIGTYEWESYTTDNVNRLFFAMNWYDPNGPQTGNAFSQKQGTLQYDTTSKKCVMIRWDPRGAIFDSKSLKPIEGAEVTLLKKTDAGKFVLVTDNDVLGGGLHNPYITKTDGAFSFYVPDGSYKLIVKKDHYSFPAEVKGEGSYGQYKNIYYGQEFTQKGKIHEYNIPLDPNYKEIMFERITSLFKSAVNTFVK